MIEYASVQGRHNVTQVNEAERLSALRQLNLLDTPPSESFDRITRMARQLFNLPIAAVSLTDCDRLWFKSRVGVEHWSIPRDKAPCAQVADSASPLVIPDMLSDPVYRSSMLAASGVRFYAGAPLITKQGYCLGSMCVLGTDARESSAGEVVVFTDLAAMVMAQIELQHAFGRIDPVSALPNRTQFLEDLEDLARDSLPGEQRYVVLVDIASPEQVSEAVRVMGPGHVDRLLVEASFKITASLGQNRKAYHVAATQVAFLAPEDSDEQSYLAELENEVERLQSSVNSRFATTVAIGIAPFKLGEVAPVDVFRMAHSACQDSRKLEAKVGLYSDGIDQTHRRRYTVVHDFGDALDASDQLRLVFQPRVDIASGACCGAEALLRWLHPALGEIAPAEFIPMIERTALARPTTAWVLEAAVRQSAKWSAAGLDLKISVNVSAANLEEVDFVDRLQDVLARHGVPFSRLELEVTESAMMSNAGSALALLNRISALGIDLAIDDFGTGYSSLAYLQQLPAQVIKADQSFMRGLVNNERKRALVKTMIALSHNFDYRVVAEGVEDEDVLSLLLAAGCDEAQGYLFAKPMPPEDLVLWLSHRTMNIIR